MRFKSFLRAAAAINMDTGNLQIRLSRGEGGADRKHGGGGGGLGTKE